MKFQSSNRNSGFSLIELMVVLVLISIMSAVIIPEMRGTYEDALLRSTGRDLAAVFGTAYSRAVTLNRLHKVRFDRRESRYFIETSGRRVGGPGERPAQPDFPGSTGELSERISIEIRNVEQERSAAEPESVANSIEAGFESQVEKDSIRFFPDGTADAKEVVLEDRDGFRLALRINPVTARVKVVELERGSLVSSRTGGVQ